MAALPYPWATLPRVTRSSATALVTLRRVLGADSVPARALAALSDLAGTPVEVVSEAASASLQATVASETLSLRIAAPPSLEGMTPWWVVLEVEPAFAVALVARVTKRPGPRVVAAGMPGASVVGAFAAIVAAAVRRAGVPVIVSEAGSSSLVGASPSSAAAAAFAVFLDDQATQARALFPESLLASASTPFSRRDLVSLGSLTLDLPIVASRLVASASDVASLAPGDVWLLGQAWPLGRAAAALAGPVWLCAGSSESALVANLEADGRLLLRDAVEELGWTPMEEEAEEGARVAEAVGEVPVVVRVEVGSARMKAKEWSALAPGDVVGLGSRVGSTVVLRVSGVAVAEGELVDLEGEVGVRIRRRLAGG